MRPLTVDASVARVAILVAAVVHVWRQALRVVGNGQRRWKGFMWCREAAGFLAKYALLDVAVCQWVALRVGLFECCTRGRVSFEFGGSTTHLVSLPRRNAMRCSSWEVTLGHNWQSWGVGTW